MKYIRKFKNVSDYEALNPNGDGGLLDLPNVSYVVENNGIHFNPYIPPKPEVGDALMWDNVGNEKVFVKPDALNVTDYPSERYTPIGVVVIPSSHDVYGTGECGVMSVKGMSYSNPDNGGSDSGIYWGYKSLDIPELPNLTQVPLISSALTSNEITGVTSNVYLPSTKFTSNKPAAGNGLDALAGYSSMTCIPSPYLENGDRNPSYYTTDTTKYPGLSANCFSDFNGKENTTIITNYATGQTDWKTASAITNDYSAGYYPAACCCWRYHTPGTNQGDWYLPAEGELGYMMVRFNEIQTTLNTLQSLYGSSSVVSLSGNLNYWSSSEYSSVSVRYVGTYYGNAGNNGKDSNYFVRAWLRS